MRAGQTTIARGAAREIGPLGSASRVLVGLIAIGLPIATAGFGRWDALALAVAPLVATAAALLVAGVLQDRGAESAPRSAHAICSVPALALFAILIGAAFAAGALTPVQGDVVLWVFLGASMLLAAARGDGGCEVLAFPNALTGRGDRIGCILFTPIDVAESRRRAGLAARD